MKTCILFLALVLIRCLTEECASERILRKVHLQPFVGPFYGSMGNAEQQVGLHRVERDTSLPNQCKFPHHPNDATLDCEIFETRILCKHACIFGHTFADGAKDRRMSCILSENAWKPYPTFDKCEKYVLCSLRLLPNGKSKCFSNFVDKPPYCDIECDVYEDKDAVPSQRYECTENGEWYPELPFCAMPDTDYV